MDPARAGRTYGVAANDRARRRPHHPRNAPQNPAPYRHPPLHQLGGEQLGKTLLIPREQLIRELEAFLPRDDAELPARTPSQIRRLHREAENFRFPDVRGVERRTVDELPAAVQLGLGRLTIEVADLRDLCAQLWVLLETCKDDWEGVEKRLEGSV